MFVMVLKTKSSLCGLFCHNHDNDGRWLTLVDSVTVRTPDDAKPPTLWYLGLENVISMLLAYAQISPVNVHAAYLVGIYMERLDCLIVCTVYSLCAKATLLCTYLICFLDATSRYAHIVIGPVLKKNGCMCVCVCVGLMSGTPKGSLKVILRRSWESNLGPLVYKA